MRSLLFLALTGFVASDENAYRPTLVKAAEGKADLPSPQEIHVSGAGNAAIDGVYVLSNPGDEIPSYMQQSGSYEIWYNSSRAAWYMGNSGWAWCGSTYKCPAPTASRVPPRSGWCMGWHGRSHCIHEGSCTVDSCTQCVPTLTFKFDGENPLPSSDDGVALRSVPTPGRRRTHSFCVDALVDDAGIDQRRQQIDALKDDNRQARDRRTTAQEIETRKQIRQALLRKLTADIEADTAEQDRLMLENTLQQRLRYRNMLYTELEKAVRVARETVECTIGEGENAITYIAELSGGAGSAIQFKRRYQKLTNSNGTATEDCEDSFNLSSLRGSTPSFESVNETARIVHHERYHPGTPGDWNHFPNGCGGGSVWEEGTDAYTERWRELETKTERWSLVYDLENGWTGKGVWRSQSRWWDCSMPKQVKFLIGGVDVWEIINPSITADRRQEVTQTILDELAAICNGLR